MEKGTSLQELRNEWTYVDLLKANALLDMEADTAAGVDELPQPK